MASIGGIDLGDIQTERQSKSGQLFQFALPTKDSNLAVLLDYFGVMRKISVSGIITGVDATHVSFIEAIEAIVDGAQGSGEEFVSSKTGIANKNVFIDTFDWNVRKGDVSKIEYSLSLIEGSASIAGT